MITNPRHGWCDFTLGTFTGTPSYLTDVPVDLLDAFLDYHRKGMGIAWFDEEGSDFTFVILPCSLFIIEEKDSAVLHSFPEIKIEDLERELISDLERSLYDWADFITGDNYKEVLEHKSDIRQRIARLKEYIGEKYEV